MFRTLGAQTVPKTADDRYYAVWRVLCVIEGGGERVTNTAWGILWGGAPCTKRQVQSWKLLAGNESIWGRSGFLRVGSSGRGSLGELVDQLLLVCTTICGTLCTICTVSVYDAVSDLMHNWVAQTPDFKSALRVVKMVLNTQCYQYLWLTIQFHAKKSKETLKISTSVGQSFSSW